MILVCIKSTLRDTRTHTKKIHFELVKGMLPLEEKDGRMPTN